LKKREELNHRNRTWFQRPGKVFSALNNKGEGGTKLTLGRDTSRLTSFDWQEKGVLRTGGKEKRTNEKTTGGGGHSSGKSWLGRKKSPRTKVFLRIGGTTKRQTGKTEK